jgi:DNA-binding transcriptional regulator YhcF (GntR family)
MRAATSERIRMFRKVIETLPSEDIRTFLTEAEKAGVSREEILEVAPPFLRKRILELK